MKTIVITGAGGVLCSTLAGVSTTFWLCDEGSKFITGIVVPIDGGFSAYSGI